MNVWNQLLRKLVSLNFLLKPNYLLWYSVTDVWTFLEWGSCQTTSNSVQDSIKLYPLKNATFRSTNTKYEHSIWNKCASGQDQEFLTTSSHQNQSDPKKVFVFLHVKHVYSGYAAQNSRSKYKCNVTSAYTWNWFKV